jgi:hypothetical protein
MSSTKKQIVVQDVLELLKKGYTRYTKDDAGFGSIQNHYGLTGVQVKRLFLNPKLKARKTILPKDDLDIVDNDELSLTSDKTEGLGSILPITDDVTGLEIAKVVVDSLPELVDKERLFS